MTDNLFKPCPKCKSNIDPYYGHVPGRVHFVECVCGYSVWGDRDTDDLVKLWNKEAEAALAQQDGDEE